MGNEVLAENVVEASRGERIALELADDGACVNVVDARKPHPLRDHAEGHAVRLLPRIGAVARAVKVQDHVVVTRPFRDGLDGGIADHKVDHDDDAAKLLSEVGALVHLFHGSGGDVQVRALHLTRLGLRLVHGFHAVEEALAPMHEGLRVDVLVVLREVEAALQRFVNDAPIVAAREAELRLHGRAEKRAAELVETLALHDDARGRASECLHVSNREPHVFEAKRLQRLEAENVADDGCREVGNRAALKQIEVIGDVGEILAGGVRHGIDAVALRAVFFASREPVGPTTVQVAVELSPATAALASMGSTPSCGVTRKSAMRSVSLG